MTASSPRSFLSSLARALAAIAGGGLLLLGLLTLPLYVLAPLVVDNADSQITFSVLLAGLGTLGIVLGALLLVQGARSLLAIPGRRAWFPRPRWTLLLGGGLFGVMILLGMTALTPGGLVSAYAFPPFHVVAQALPPLIVLALAGWLAMPRPNPGSTLTGRQLTAQLAYGSLGATSLAMGLEIVLMVLLIMAVVALILLVPGRLDAWTELVDVVRSSPYWTEDTELLRQLLAMPEALVVLGAITLVIAPLTEETVKALGVAIMSHRARTASAALLMGLAAGAGFAIAESLLNGAGALDPLDWGSVAVLRFGSSLMHCFTGALMGLGWYYAIWRRNPWRLLGAYGLCLGIHFAWNVLASAMGVAPVLLPAAGGLPVGDIAAVGLAGLLLVDTAIMLAILLWLARRLRPAAWPQPADLALDI